MIFNKQHKRGGLKLAILVAVICLLVGYYNRLSYQQGASLVLNEDAQCFVDNQKRIALSLKNNKNTYYVNYITDYSGYKLGLSTNEIDRLLAYKAAGKKIYTLQDFQKVSGIESSKLDSIQKLLVFPKVKVQKFKRKRSYESVHTNVKLDLNIITSETLEKELKLPNFIANRIIKFRTYLKGYRSLVQLEDVYGILPYQLKHLNENCVLVNPPNDKKSIHELSYYELSKVPYLNNKQSKQIIIFVKNNGKLTSFNDLLKIDGIPKNKIARLPLYLSLN